MTESAANSAGLELGSLYRKITRNMKSPFPGMDPWLELHWRDVHARLIIYIANQIQQQLPEPLVARAEVDVAVDVDDHSFRMRPDVQAAEDKPGAGNGGVAVLPPVVAVAEPLLVRAPEEVHRWVEILDPSSGGRIVTVIEVLSPSNKVPGPARSAYRAKQRDLLSAGINLVEIDLVRKGDWVFSVDVNNLDPNKRTPYMACVFRAIHSDRRAVYPMLLRERLPTIAIPLRPGVRDVALDLQKVLDEAYVTGRYDRTDYQTPLNPPLSPEEAAWSGELLRKAGKITT